MTRLRKNPDASVIRTRLPLSRRTPYHLANKAVNGVNKRHNCTAQHLWCENTHLTACQILRPAHIHTYITQCPQKITTNKSRRQIQYYTVSKQATTIQKKIEHSILYSVQTSNNNTKNRTFNIIQCSEKAITKK